MIIHWSYFDCILFLTFKIKLERATVSFLDVCIYILTKESHIKVKPFLMSFFDIS